MAQVYAYPRPDPKKDHILPIVVIAVLDVSGIYGELSNEPRLLVAHRGSKVSYCKDAWSFPAGFIDNRISRTKGISPHSALFQSRMELASELGLFQEDFVPETVSVPVCVDRYLRDDQQEGKKFDTFLVAEQIVQPQNVYLNWEHTNLLWIPVAELITGNMKRIPEQQTPNLIPDIGRLRPVMESLHRQWLARIQNG